MKSLSELRKMVTSALESTVLFEVETNTDTDGGWYFNHLDEAYIHLSRVLKAQTNTNLFECDDFTKIDYIRLSIHFVDKPTEILPVVQYTRKSDTEFIETELL